MSQPPLPDHTAVRVALWRALHLELDPPPHVFRDPIGALLVGEENWRERPDMNASFSRPMRASIVGRARFVEDLLAEAVSLGTRQYVLLGAGLDTFAQREPGLAAHLQIFEVDQPATQAWKRQRLAALSLPLPAGLRFVPVDFEAGESWWEKLAAAGFRSELPSVVVSTGVSLYLARETNELTLRQLAKLAPGSTFAMTFLLALERLGPEERATMEFVMKRAAESGVPFRSLFTPEEMLAMGRAAGFREAQYVSAEDLYQRYFAGRRDGLRAGAAEAFFVGRL